MFSRPVSSGWNPVPTSSRLPMRPNTSASPVLGMVIRLRILSSVLLPAPLRPTMPTTSPSWISSDTSLSAQNSSCSARAKGCFSRCVSASAAVVGAEPVLCRMVYVFDRFRTETARSLDDIGELPLEALERVPAGDEQDHAGDGGVGNRSKGRSGGVQHRPPEGLEEAGERVERIEQMEALRYRGD